MAGNEQDEIEQIMSEIEELQKEISPEPAPVAEPQVAAASETTIAAEEEDILREIQASAQSDAGGSDAGLEETLSELKEEEATGGLLGDMKVEETMSSHSNDDTGTDGTLSLNVTGNMTLKLKYEFEGQEVTISFVDQALRVQMTDGTEFKVPFVRNSQSNVRPFKKAI